MAPKSLQKNTEVKNERKISLLNVSSRVLLRPRITEKGSDLSHRSNAYAFDVSLSATKLLIKKAVGEIYKVKAIKIAMLPVRAKSVFVRGKKGKTSRGKKAYVYLKEGDKIEFV